MPRSAPCWRLWNRRRRGPGGRDILPRLGDVPRGRSIAPAIGHRWLALIFVIGGPRRQRQSRRARASNSFAEGLRRLVTSVTTYIPALVVPTLL